MQEISPHVFLSDEVAATTPEALRCHRIKAVLRVTWDAATKHVQEMYDREDVAYIFFPMMDRYDFDIRQHFAVTNAIIHAYVKQGKNILVHCAAGVSRSPTIVAAYLATVMLVCSSEQLLDQMARLRPCVNPNFGFRDQLQEYFEALYRRRVEPQNDLREGYWRM
jgi:protein-tyrosine phosphatase